MYVVLQICSVYFRIRILSNVICFTHLLFLERERKKDLLGVFIFREFNIKIRFFFKGILFHGSIRNSRGFNKLRPI